MNHMLVGIHCWAPLAKTPSTKLASGGCNFLMSRASHGGQKAVVTKSVEPPMPMPNWHTKQGKTSSKDTLRSKFIGWPMWRDISKQLGLGRMSSHAPKKQFSETTTAGHKKQEGCLVIKAEQEQHSSFACKATDRREPQLVVLQRRVLGRGSGTVPSFMANTECNLL